MLGIQNLIFSLLSHLTLTALVCVVCYLTRFMVHKNLYIICFKYKFLCNHRWESQRQRGMGSFLSFFSKILRFLSWQKSLFPKEMTLLILMLCCTPSIRDRVHRNENFVEIIPVFSTFSNFFKKKKKIIKAILCNFSMRLLKYF